MNNMKFQKTGNSTNAEHLARPSIATQKVPQFTSCVGRSSVDAGVDQSPLQKLLRLPDVLAIVPVARSSWYQGVRDGVYPKPVRISARSVAWLSSDIRRLIQDLTNTPPNA